MLATMQLLSLASHFLLQFLKMCLKVNYIAIKRLVVVMFSDIY